MASHMTTLTILSRGTAMSAEVFLTIRRFYQGAKHKLALPVGPNA